MAVLVDRTLSVSGHGIADYPIYFNNHVFYSMHPGERVLIESISDQDTLSDPPLRAVDTTLPVISAPDWTFNDDYQSYVNKCRASLTAQLPSFSSAVAEAKARTAAAFAPDNLAKNSFILDGIESVAEFLGHQVGQKTLVIFSDGIEDSAEYDTVIKFDSPGFWKRVSTDKLIAQLKGQHRIPNLSGVEVYFVGAATKRPEEFRDNQNFWEAYFKASGVDPKHLHYGHQPTWEETAVPATPADFEKSVCDTKSF